MTVDRPIIFSAPMVLALLAGRKTMTRRLAPQTGIRSPWQNVKAGDRLWVKENYWMLGRWVGKKKAGKVSYSFARAPDCAPIYCADEPFSPFPPVGGKFDTSVAWNCRPSIYMPRVDSRLTVVVGAARIERVQAISDADAIAEGLVEMASHVFGAGGIEYGPTPRLAYKELWSSLHGPESWKANPEVVVISGTVHQANIDAMPKAEAA